MELSKTGKQRVGACHKQDQAWLDGHKVDVVNNTSRGSQIAIEKHTITQGIATPGQFAGWFGVERASQAK